MIYDFYNKKKVKIKFVLLRYFDLKNEKMMA